MRLKPRSVRIRLTIWYAASLTAIVACFALGVYLLVRVSLLREVDTELKKDLATVTRVIREEPYEINELAQHGSVDLFQVREGNDIIAETGGWSRGALEKVFTEHNADGPDGMAGPWSWESPGDQHYRVTFLSAITPGHAYIVAVAEDEQTMRTSLNSLAMILLLGVPIALAVAIVGGYFLAGRVLRPIGAMAAKANEITAERLSERLPVENADDEFGRLAAAFNQVFARLQDSFDRLRRFTADASHELRTPLTAIRSVGEVGLQKALDTAASREVIASMLEESDRLSKLVDGLLTLSRTENGSVSTVRQTIDAAALTAEVVDCIIVLAEEKEQAILNEICGPVLVEAEAATLRQAIMNIIDNAVKYAPRHGHITVRVGQTVQDEAVIEVLDDGPGIPMEHQSRIFERFYRVDKGRSREVGGTGLGLAIASWAVKANGGRIDLESSEGHGSSFKIVIPLRK